MATVGRLAVVLTASATDFERTMGRAARSVKTTEKEFMRSARQMEGIGRRWSAGVTAPIVAMLGILAKSAIPFKAFKQEAQQAFSVLLGSQEAAKKHMEDILAFAKTTPFAFPDLVDAYRTLSAFGMEAQRTHPVIEAVANAVAAMGGGAGEISDLADVFARIESQGKVTALELNRLGAKGINAVRIMANKAGVSVETMRKMISSGTVDSRRAIDWLVDGIMNGTEGIAGSTVALGGSLGALKKTWKGAIDSLKAAWRNFADAVISDKIFEHLIAGVHRLTDMIKRAQEMAEAFGRLPAPIQKTVWGLVLLVAAIGPAFLMFGLLNRTIAAGIALYYTLASFIGNVAFAFTAWRMGAAKLGESLVFLAGGPVKLVILAIGALIVAVILLAANWDKLRGYAVAAWGAISAAALYAASLVVRGIGLIVSAIGFIIPAVRGAGQSLIGLANNLKASAGAALSSAKSTYAATKAANQAAKAQEQIAKSGSDAVDAQEDLGKAIKGAGKAASKTLLPFDEIHTMQADLSKSSAAGAGLDDMLDFTDIVAPEIPDIAMPGIGGIADAASGVTDTLSRAAETMGGVWDKLKEKMEPVNKAVQWIKDNWPTIGPIVEDIASIIMVLLIPALIKSGIEALIAAGKHVTAWVVSGWAALLHGGKIVGQLLLIIAKWIWAGIQALIHAGKVVLAWAMQGWQALISGAIQVGQFIILGAKWVWLGVLALVEAGKIVVAWVMQKVEAITSVAVQVAQFIILGAKWVWMGIVAMANAAVMAAAWLVAMGPIVLVVAAVIALAILIIANWEKIKKWTVKIWEAVAGFFTDLWEGIKKVFSAVWEFIKDLFLRYHPIGLVIAHWETIKEFFTGLWDSVKKIFSNAWKNIKQIFSAENAKKLFNSVLTAIKNVFQNIPNWFKTKFSDAWTKVKNVFSSGGKIFSGIKEGIASTFKTIVNGLVNGINTIIRVPFNKVNSMLNTIRDISVLGASPFKSLWGYNPLPVPQIPKLAKGTRYVPEDMLAYLHKGEAVIPEKYNPVRAGTAAAVAAGGGSGGGGGGRGGIDISDSTIEKLGHKIAAILTNAAMGGTSDEPLIIQLNIGSSRVLEEIIDAARRKNAKAGKTVITVGV